MIDKVGKLITKIFGSKSEKDIKFIQPLIEEIKSFSSVLEKLTDDGRVMTQDLNGKASTREVTDRVLELITGQNFSEID